MAMTNMEFYREDLNFSLTKDYFTVDGYYYFRNLTDKEINILLAYPFPSDSLMGAVDSVFALDHSGNSIMVQTNQKFMNFRVNIAPHDSTVCRIGYMQEVRDHYAKYILLTTRAWGKPFTQVHYQLITKAKKITCSYPPDHQDKRGKLYYYQWHMTNFMPDKDFIIKY